MKKIIKKIIVKGNSIVRGDIFRRGISKDKLVILMYHSVKKELFSSHISYLMRYYNIISYDRAIKLIKGEEKIPYPLTITFDDGYKSLMRNAYPVLKKHRLRAIVFLVYDYVARKKFAWWDIASFLGYDVEKIKKLPGEKFRKLIASMEKKIKPYHNTKFPPDEWKFLDKHEILKMRDVFDFGSHTITHPILTNLSTEEVEREVSLSKKLLEKHLGIEIKHFCYPNGNYNHNVKSIVKNYYNSACTTRRGRNNVNCDEFELKRIGINEKDDLSILKTKLALW